MPSAGAAAQDPGGGRRALALQVRGVLSREDDVGGFFVGALRGARLLGGIGEFGGERCQTQAVEVGA